MRSLFNRLLITSLLFRTVSVDVRFAPRHNNKFSHWNSGLAEGRRLQAHDLHNMAAATISREVSVDAGKGVHLSGNLDLPAGAKGIVVFAHGSGSGRFR